MDITKNKINNLFYQQNSFIYSEIFLDNSYHIFPEDVKNQIIIDCGCHYGFFSALCLQYGAKSIIGVEMDYTNYIKCLNNLEYLSKNYHIYNAALSSFPGIHKVFYKNSNHHCTITDEPTYYNVESINLIDIIEKHIGTNEKFVLKMDIEGSEYDVLYNLPPRFFKMIDKIFIEIHGSKQKRMDLRNFIQSQGFYEDFVNQLIVDGKEGETQVNKYIHV